MDPAIYSPFPTPSRRSIGLPLTLAVSVLLHLIVAFLITLFGVFSDAVAVVREELTKQREIKFVFAPTGSQALDGSFELAPNASQHGPLLVPDTAAAPAPTDDVAALLPDRVSDLFQQPTPPPLELPKEERSAPEVAEAVLAPTEFDPQQTPKLPDLEIAKAGAEDLTARDAFPDDPSGTFTSPRDASRVLRPAPWGDPSLSDRLSAFDRELQRQRPIREPLMSGPPRNVFVPDWSSLPATGQSVGQLVFESTDYDFNDYGRQIYWILWKTWHNRIYARVDDFEKWSREEKQWMLQHANGVSFSIAADGDVYDIVLELPSGCEPFDLSATEALDAVVFPPLPPDFPRSQERVQVTFQGNGSINTMRRYLSYLKAKGVF